MKKILFLLTIALVGSLWAAGEMTVQVISAVYEKSVTKELDANVKKTGLEVHKKIEDGRYVVTLGTLFPTLHCRSNPPLTDAVICFIYRVFILSLLH